MKNPLFELLATSAKFSGLATHGSAALRISGGSGRDDSMVGQAGGVKDGNLPSGYVKIAIAGWW